MKKRKMIFAVSILGGLFALCVVVVLAFGALLSAKGFSFSTGRLYFADNGNYLIENGDKAMLVADCSDDKELFKSYKNGDKVILFHKGVDTSYPAQTGGYHIVRFAKGDGTYRPSDEILGIGILSDSMEIPVESSINYDVQYIRTNGYHEGAEYPLVKIIRSVDELNAYYNANKDKYDLERHEKVYSDTTIGFLDACDKYDQAYFDKQELIIVLLEEGSGSVRHKVESVIKGTDDICYISIDTMVPEVGTDDMAEWHILIEPEADVDIASESDVIVYLDGVNPKTQPDVVREAGSFSNITLTIPYDWNYEIERGNNTDEYCIAFWPEDQKEGKIKMWYYTAFGVCGTGLKQKEITIGAYKAREGTFDNRKIWNFISFEEDVPGSYVAMNEGADKWWSQYGDEAMQILSTIKIAEDIITEEQVIDLVKKDVTVEYNQIDARFDRENGLWTISFYKKNTAGGNQGFTVTHEGKIIQIEYGE
ncbi:MAG: hypothetical protein IKA09_00030 [Lachnospiraceae bacterium]|nr:hypothetical protein [Lachnospiraceae bacterium]